MGKNWPRNRNFPTPGAEVWQIMPKNYLKVKFFSKNTLFFGKYFPVGGVFGGNRFPGMGIW